MDETFKTALRLFAQIYKIHGSRRMMDQGNVERQTPAVLCPHAFLLNKTQAVYERFFQQIKLSLGMIECLLTL